MGPPPVQRGFFHQWGWKKAGMAARKAEEKRRGHRAAVPPARPMRRHRPREGGKRSIGRERLPDSHVPPSPIPWKRARNQPGMYFVGNGRKIAHVANGVIRTGKNDSGSSPRAWGCFLHKRGAALWMEVFPTCVGVFRIKKHGAKLRKRFPHARGGVSYSDKVGKEVYGSSPRTRGRAWMNALFSLAFPTRMGCFSFIRRGRSAFC